MYDLTVDGTHTVVMKNGIITHQCEDHSFLGASIEPALGVAYGFAGSTGHAFLVYVHENELYIMETNNIRDFRSFKVMLKRGILVCGICTEIFFRRYFTVFAIFNTVPKFVIIFQQTYHIGYISRSAFLAKDYRNF